MVARPSLKRVVPGSVPPWRALCAESARALKAFFSVLCVSKSVWLLESKFGKILRALNLRAFWVRPSCPRVGRGRGGAPPQLLWPSGRASAGGPGLVSSCERVFFVAPSLFRAGFATSFRLIRSLSTFAVETLLALRGAELPSSRGVAAKRELEIIAKLLGLLHEALLDVVSCAQKLAATLCPCNVLLAACQFVLFAARRFLQFVTYFVGRAAC